MLNKIKRTLGFIITHPLARKNKMRAVAEFLIWQVQTTFFPQRPFKKKFAHKLNVLVKKGQTGMTGNVYAGLHEFVDMAFLLHFLRPSDTFVDAGANVGSYTLLASGVSGAKSISFEPVPSAFKHLDTNVRLNNLEKLVETHNKGLSSTKGILNFSFDNDTTNHVLPNNSNMRALEVEVSALDEIVKDNYPSLLKIDVEGYETEVLEGSVNILNNQTLKAIIIELNGSGERYGYKDQDIHNNLTKLKFRPYTYNAFSRSLNLASSYGETNTIYVRDYPFVSERLKTSQSFRIFDVEF